MQTRKESSIVTWHGDVKSLSNIMTSTASIQRAIPEAPKQQRMEIESDETDHDCCIEALAATVNCFTDSSIIGTFVCGAVTLLPLLCFELANLANKNGNKKLSYALYGSACLFGLPGATAGALSFSCLSCVSLPIVACTGEPKVVIETMEKIDKYVSSP